MIFFTITCLCAVSICMSEWDKEWKWDSFFSSRCCWGLPRGRVRISQVRRWGGGLLLPHYLLEAVWGGRRGMPASREWALALSWQACCSRANVDPGGCWSMQKLFHLLPAENQRSSNTQNCLSDSLLPYAVKTEKSEGLSAEMALVQLLHLGRINIWLCFASTKN